ncbi:hydroxymethylglutaryl-CoA lyase [Neobacillus piezotolerans]|uniref:Hydroxymethylglutaryl-CoA lyase n=1 Tax=Neobacillus piezotolerans TaxID=2259171 RepID=A0A3D8GKL2_9BACI|nr:hydroxymethylglutaryl-CoA lyase [Neobacillus piezotolerans]RDU34983.1 hydroxymethylglutaryl-CoA lyase [Neobacillus piezotolerans]
MAIKLPENVTIIEVGPRDGLQNEKGFVPTEVKGQFIHALRDSGIREMELTSFVSPKWVPQMADAAEIVSACYDAPGRSIVLAPNKKGIERLEETNCRAVAVFVGVSNTFNKKNINKTTAESMEELRPLIADLKEKGYFVRACISTAWHCPYEGKIPEADTLRLCADFAEAGVDELSVADTIGMAVPTEAHSLFAQLKAIIPGILLTAHFHDTRKLALANILASMQAGIDRFDTSAGGLGGCPFAPGATGNVATEDVVYMLERMGIKTGIALDRLMDAVEIVRPHVSRPIESTYFNMHASAGA